MTFATFVGCAVLPDGDSTMVERFGSRAVADSFLLR